MRHVTAPGWLRDGTAGTHADPLAATGRRVGWGVVATGVIAGKVTAQLARLEDALLVAVSSRDAGRAAAFAREHGFRRSYGDEDGSSATRGEGGRRDGAEGGSEIRGGSGASDGADRLSGYQRLAQDPDVEVVYVATPHGQHHEVAGAMLRAGKHVLVEKAFTINEREARELAALARARGLFLMEALWTRFLPAYQHALDVLERGDVGQVRYVQAELGFMAAADGRSRLWEPEAGGGALLDLAVYPLTWAVGALGYPQQVHAAGRLNEEGVDELEALTLSYAGGAQAQLLTSFVTAKRSRARIVGTAGALVTEGTLTRPEGIAVTGEHASHTRFSTTEPLYAYQLREVTRCVQEGLGESPTMPLEDSLKTMALLDEARRQLGVRYPNDAHP